MIRSIRLRLLRGNPSQIIFPFHSPVRLPLVRSSSSASAAVVPESDLEDEIEDEVEPYGNDYGAGPSRIPYNRKSTSGGTTRARLSLSEESGLVRAQEVLGLPRIDRTTVANFLNGRSCPDRLAELDQVGHTAVVRRLSLTKSYGLAARYTLKVVNTRPPNDLGKITFPPQLIEDMFTAILRTDLSTENATSQMKALLGILDYLQRTRTPRSETLYQLVLDRLCIIGQYDTAAKIYVGLVEEWVMEGRVAEGADPESFYEGGGPPREGRDKWESRSAMYKTWWKGVRTWVLPGEVLSPHDRLDLWHPRKQRIPERLRRFPMPIPTSPPSIVPVPTVAHLMAILDRVELDPEKATPEAFERSMRACAILASTILSRTIPYVPSRLLRGTLNRTPVEPPVYPEKVRLPKREDNRWAYTAHTHIHLAIRSILLSPPAMPHMLKYMIDYDQAKTQGTSLPSPPEFVRYRTAALGLSSVIYLMQYSLRKLRSANAVKYLVGYARRSFTSEQMTSLYNAALRESTRLKALWIGSRFAQILFGNTQLAPNAPPLSSLRPHRLEENPRVVIEPFERAEMEEFTKQLSETGQIPVNTESFEALLENLSRTRQSGRFIDAVYKLIPYLQWPPERTNTEYRELGIISERGAARVAPNSLTPRLYSIMLRGLAEFRVITLGRRVFRLALAAEQDWRRDSVDSELSSTPYRLENELFRWMIDLWRLESTRNPSRSMRDDSAWIPPKGLEHLARRDAAERMIVYVYIQARKRWQHDLRLRQAAHIKGGPTTSRYEPTADFFTTMILGCARRWGLHQDRDWSVGLTTVATGPAPDATPRAQIINEMKMVVEDMRAWGFEPPLSLGIQLGEVDPWPLDRVRSDAKWASYSKVEPRSRYVVQVLPVVDKSPSVDVELESFPRDWYDAAEQVKRQSEFA